MIHIDTVRQAMTDKKMSPVGLADRLGVSKQTVAGWLSGLHHPQEHNFFRLCRVLDLSWFELVYGKKKKVTTKILCEE